MALPIFWSCVPPPSKKKIPLNGGKRRKKTLMRTRGAVCIDFQYVKWDLVQRRVVRIYMVLSTFYILDKRKHSSHITILKKKYKIRQWIINILLLPPQNPPVYDVWCVCVCVCVQCRTYVHVQTLADGVNNGWRCKQEEESPWALWVWACACVSCRFCAGRHTAQTDG